MSSVFVSLFVHVNILFGELMSATHFNTLQHTGACPVYASRYLCMSIPYLVSWEVRVRVFQIPPTYVLQHTATHCNALQHTTATYTATHCNTLYGFVSVAAKEPPASHCNTMQHTAAHCNTPLQLTLQHAVWMYFRCRQRTSGATSSRRASRVSSTPTVAPSTRCVYIYIYR